MALSIDHIVIHVGDLQSAIQNYQNAGFTVNYGGQHGDGITENALIIFGDGTYIELIAVVDGKNQDDAGFKQLLKESGEGYTGFALQSTDIEADLASMRERGVDVGDIIRGERLRADGEKLEWKMAKLDNAMSPFVIEDISERDLRVPLTTENVTHANGATGIHELLIHVSGFQDAIDQYGSIVGAPLIFLGVARYQIGSSAMVLMETEDADSSPQLLSLYTDETDPKRVTLHGADFMFI